jgi:membrane protein DedA with SNARE-associated domain
VSLLSHEELHHLVATWGYGGIAVMTGLEGVGIPLPGETTLIVAALYAASGHDLNILGVAAAAALGAGLGDNLGFWLGRILGYRLLLRWRGPLRLSDAKIKLGQYLFLRHGAKVVLAARFVAVLRVLAPLLAGANLMRWRRFVLADAAGAGLWAATYGGGAFLLGRRLMNQVAPSLGWLLLAAAALAIAAGVVALRRGEAALLAAAEAALPGPLRTP